MEESKTAEILSPKKNQTIPNKYFIIIDTLFPFTEHGS